MKKILFVFIFFSPFLFAQQPFPMGIVWGAYGNSGGAGGGTWGSITGTLSSQTDLQSALDAKASTSGIYPTSLTQGYLPYRNSGDTIKGIPIAIELQKDSSLQNPYYITQFPYFPMDKNFIIDSVGFMFSTPFAGGASVTPRIMYNDSVVVSAQTVKVKYFAAATNTKVFVYQTSISNATVPAGSYLFAQDTVVTTACGLMRTKIYGRVQ